MISYTRILLVLASIASCTALITNGGNTICIMASGNISDFGYSNTVNTGRITMERNLNISGTYYASNIEDEPTAFALMQQLVSEGYRLIISTTSAHGTAALLAAQLYPNVSFVQYSGTSTLPNLSVLSFSGPDLYYMVGVFCGAMTKNNKVGFIHPNAPTAALQTLNAFYVGVKSINPLASVYVVYTDSYLNPDRTLGASNILLNITGVDQLAGQQDDFTLQTETMAAGYLAVGANGYSLRNIFGEAIGISVLRNWGAPFTTYAQGVLSTTGVFRKDITANFASGYTTLDEPSYLVPAAAYNDILDVVNQLKNKSKPYYCSPWVAEFGLNASTGCLISTATFNSAVLSQINQLGTYLVPLTEVTFPKATGDAIIALAAVLWAFTCAISAALFYLRRDTVMLASSPLFLALVLVGCSMVYLSSIAWVVEPTLSGCMARIWVPSIGFTLSMGAMIIKNVRLWLIFDAQLKKIRIRDIKLLIYTGVLLAADVLLLALWTGLGKPIVDTEQAVDGLGTYQTKKICDTLLIGDRILYAIIALHAGQLAVGCIVTFKIRVIDIEEFNESRPFGLCIYIVSLVCTIAGILIGTTGTTTQQTIIIICFSLLIGAGAVLFVLFVPKFLTIFVKGSRPIDRILKSVRSKGSSSNEKTTASASAPPKVVEAKEKPPAQLQVI